MMKRLFLIPVMCIAGIAKMAAYADIQQIDTVISVSVGTSINIDTLLYGDVPSGEWESIEDDSMAVLESMNISLDSLLKSWHARTYLNVDTSCVSSNVNPTFSDSVYYDRIMNMPCIVPMAYNQPVRTHIDRYATRLRRQVSYMLGMMEFYEPIIEQALDVYGVPNELKYLPVIESAMNPKAVSRAGATGMWQFMYGTGKMYGLKQNSLVDDRRDPIKSTWAAAKHLRDLYNMFGDWGLAIAAYNCGPGNVNKAISRSGGKRNFWEIYWHLPRETRGYFPAFIAATYIMTYHAEHNICPMKSAMPIATDTIQVNQLIHLEQIAKVCDIDMEMLRALNPQYKEDVIPGKFQPNSLRLPSEKVYAFINASDSVYNYHRDEYFSPQKQVELKHQTTNKGVVYHRIRGGESLSTIARKYHVSVSQIKRWNGMRNDAIYAGKRLKIYPR